MVKDSAMQPVNVRQRWCAGLELANFVERKSIRMGSNVHRHMISRRVAQSRVHWERLEDSPPACCSCQPSRFCRIKSACSKECRTVNDRASTSLYGLQCLIFKPGWVSL
jgi:hypothetical protein